MRSPGSTLRRTPAMPTRRPPCSTASVVSGASNSAPSRAMRNVNGAAGFALVRLAASAGELHRNAVDRDDAIARLEARARGRLAFDHLVDHRRAEIGGEAEERHEVAFPVRRRERRQRNDPRRRSSRRDARTVSAASARPGCAQQPPAQILPASHRRAVDRRHEIAVAHAGRARQAFPPAGTRAARR